MHCACVWVAHCDTSSTGPTTTHCGSVMAAWMWHAACGPGGGRFATLGRGFDTWVCHLLAASGLKLPWGWPLSFFGGWPSATDAVALCMGATFTSVACLSTMPVASPTIVSAVQQEAIKAGVWRLCVLVGCAGKGLYLPSGVAPLRYGQWASSCRKPVHVPVELSRHNGRPQCVPLW